MSATSWAAPLFATAQNGTHGFQLLAVPRSFLFALKDVVPPAWDPVHAGYSWLWETVADKRYFAFAPIVITLVFELLVNGLYTALDLLRLPALERFRTSYAGKPRPYPPPAEIIAGFRIMLGGYLRLILPVQGLLAWALWTGRVSLGESDPAAVWWGQILLEELACVMLADLWDYWVHRLMHRPYFYARFHRLHHDFIYTHVSANHAFHDVELFLYGLSVGIPPLLIRGHLLTSWVHTAFTILHTAAQHSGYNFLFQSASEFHDGHHILVNKNFAPHLPLMDMIHGTYARNTEAERRETRERAYQTRVPLAGAFAFWTNGLAYK
ncbi:hypothetical protein DFJ74DRAFT_705926 [Hyaloraphidium curvatum]|nr:hypothetical protein DFJ74DRAFT_705926 [Hyaloraphidium curvatum]